MCATRWTRAAAVVAACLLLMGSGGEATAGGGRKALVIGNASYAVKPLENPVRDADLLYGPLEKAGFEVKLYHNLTRDQMASVVNSFVSGLRAGDTAFVYFAGHGVEVGPKRVNVLYGTDVTQPANHQEAIDSGYRMDRLLECLEQVPDALKIVVIDACRDDPFGGTRSMGGRGLAAVPKEQLPRGTYIAFASAAGQPADDGRGRNNGPFAEALAEHLVRPGLELNLVFREVTAAVMTRTRGAQEPWHEERGVQGQFYFVWAGQPPAPPRPVEAQRPAAPVSQRANPAGIEWITIPGGSFAMGSTKSSDEQPPHSVRVSTFQLGRTEVTVAQYRRCVDAGTCSKPETTTYCNWGKGGRDDHPVNCVSWDDARAFATFAGGRLPTEAEWEYAARSGGRDQAYPWGDGTATCERAVVSDGGDGCGRDRTWPVCSLPDGNSTHGVCDLAGNVWEWVEDDYHGSYGGAPSDGSAWTDRPRGSRRVCRGGSWYNDAGLARAASRLYWTPDDRSYTLGFRLARSAP